MKRKRRSVRRKPPKKPQVVAANVEPANSAFQTEEEYSRWDGNDGVDSRMTAGTAHAGTNLNILQEACFLEEIDGSNSIPKSNLLKNIASFAATLSRAVGSSSPESTDNSLPVHDDIIQGMEPRVSHSGPLNNAQELSAALSVIQKIMEMDAAKPFNRPVDPVPLGIPDYLEVIDKPMDFSTICNNIDWGGKYRNSKDVYKDVQLIFYNCLKYHKKGDYILDLMKWVKINFTKHWNAAGLFRQEQEVDNGILRRSDHSISSFLPGFSPEGGFGEASLRNVIPSSSKGTALRGKSPHGVGGETSRKEGETNLTPGILHRSKRSDRSISSILPGFSPEGRSGEASLRNVIPSLSKGTALRGQNPHGVGGKTSQKEVETNLTPGTLRKRKRSDRSISSFLPGFCPEGGSGEASLRNVISSTSKGNAFRGQNPHVVGGETSRKEVETNLTPGILRRSKRSNRSISSFLPGFSPEDGSGEASLRNVIPSSSKGTALRGQNPLGVGGETSRKEVETNLTTGILRRSKGADCSISSFLPAFSPEGGFGEVSLRNVIPSSSKGTALRKQNPHGVGGETCRKEVETSLTPGILRRSKGADSSISSFLPGFSPEGGSGEASLRNVIPSSSKVNALRERNLHGDGGETSGKEVETSLTPGILRRSKGADRSISGFLPGFSPEGRSVEASVRNVIPSSSRGTTLREQNLHDVGGETSRKEVETSLTPSNSADGSTNMHLVTEDMISNDCEEEVYEDANGGTSSQTNDTVSHTETKRRNRASDVKSRSVNKCTRVTNLRKGKKLQVEYFNNGPVGYNQSEMVRYMGKLVRDSSIVPVRVHSWGEIDDSVKELLWESILNKFGGGDMGLRRATTLDHMKRLWQNWRGLMKRDSINKKKTIEDALEDVPNHLQRDDWEWLVKEHYTTVCVKKVSARNSENRGRLKMLHHTGSKPFREIVWSEMGGKDGHQPSISEIFKRTRMTKSGTWEEGAAEKYDEIVELEQDPSLSPFEVVEKCFGEKDRTHVVCYGVGVKYKDLRGPLPSREQLATNLREKEKENNSIKQRLEKMEENRRKEREANEQKVNVLEEKVDMLVKMAFGQY